MIFKNRKLPAVAIASLVFGGGCRTSGGGVGTPDGGSPDGGTPDELESLAEEMCIIWQRCEPDEFGAEHDSIAQCVPAMRADLETFMSELTTYYGEDCASVFMDLYACLAVDMGDCSYDYDCEHIYAQVYDACY